MFRSIWIYFFELHQYNWYNCFNIICGEIDTFRTFDFHVFIFVFLKLERRLNQKSKTQITNILFGGIPIDLWHSMKKLVNLLRRLTRINVLRLAYMKHKSCSSSIVSDMFLCIQIYLDYICSSRIYVTHWEIIFTLGDLPLYLKNLPVIF